jgi:CheY-like chemotaxis protein/two-component sensor histidine kinase
MQLIESEKMEALGKLASGTAHEFNNILAIMQGYLEVGLYELTEHEESAARKRFEQAYKTIDRGKELVSKILLYSRSTKQEYSSLSLASVVQHALTMIQRTLPATVELRQNIEQSHRAVRANPLQIEQIVINLGNNAIHAVEEDGGILEIGLQESEYITAPPEFPELLPGVYAQLIVRDNGYGMPPHVKNRIFDPFFTTKEAGKGSGLGLSIVHGIIQQHRGQIAVESAPGQGTTFTILFPTVEETPQKVSTEMFSEISAINASVETTPKQKQQREHLLLVDDVPSSVRLIALALRKLRYTVTTVHDSAEALRVFREQPGKFDLLLIDQMMPGMTGIELCQKIFTIRPDVPVILYTGNDTIDSSIIGRTGIRRMLRKPLRISQLNQTIREILEQPGKQGQE